MTKIPHHAKCKKPAPQLRLTWDNKPEHYCPGCGRSTTQIEGKNP